MTVFYTKCYDKFTRVHVFLLPYNLLGYTIANQNLFQNIVSRTTSVVFSYLNGFVVLASLPFFRVLVLISLPHLHHPPQR